MRTLTIGALPNRSTKIPDWPNCPRCYQPCTGVYAGRVCCTRCQHITAAFHRPSEDAALEAALAGAKP